MPVPRVSSPSTSARARVNGRSTSWKARKAAIMAATEALASFAPRPVTRPSTTSTCHGSRVQPGAGGTVSRWVSRRSSGPCPWRASTLCPTRTGVRAALAQALLHEVGQLRLVPRHRGDADDRPVQGEDLALRQDHRSAPVEMARGLLGRAEGADVLDHHGADALVREHLGEQAVGHVGADDVHAPHAAEHRGLDGARLGQHALLEAPLLAQPARGRRGRCRRRASPDRPPAPARRSRRSSGSASRRAGPRRAPRRPCRR